MLKRLLDLFDLPDSNRMPMSAQSTGIKSVKVYEKDTGYAPRAAYSAEAARYQSAPRQ